MRFRKKPAEIEARQLGEATGAVRHRDAVLVDWYETALRTIRGPEDRGVFMDAYRKAGGGYEGLQAIAEMALDFSHRAYDDSAAFDPDPPTSPFPHPAVMTGYPLSPDEQEHVDRLANPNPADK